MFDYDNFSALLDETSCQIRRKKLLPIAVSAADDRESKQTNRMSKRGRENAY